VQRELLKAAWMAEMMAALMVDSMVGKLGDYLVARKAGSMAEPRTVKWVSTTAAR